jgi:protein-disulfide isomerase
MMTKKTLTTNGMTLPNALYTLLNLVGVGITLYLTKHYFDLHFPTNAFNSPSAICDISSFFNCDAATFSPIAAILGVPLSIMGLLLHLLFLGSNLFPTENTERLNKTLSLINVIGCVVLFIYSLVVLKSLCPLCSVYYLISLFIFLLLLKKSELPFSVPPKTAGVYLVIAVATFGLTRFQTVQRVKTQEKLADQIIKQFNDLPDLGKPSYLSPLLMTKGQSIETAPIWIVEFSDFQCPFCGRIAEQMAKIKKKYQGKVAIYYYPYPLDNDCNPKIERSFHPYACKAARLASCDIEKFPTIHDQIFKDQASINDDLLAKIEANNGLALCEKNEAGKEIIAKSMEVAESYKIKSTPTLIINGKKIEGSLPTIQYFKLFDSILNK